MQQATYGDEPFDNEARLQQLERRYRRIQNSLTSATAMHESLCESPSSSERQLERTRREVEQLQRQLRVVLDSLDRVEEQQDRLHSA